MASVVCHDEFSAIGNSGARGQPVSSATSMQDYNDDYNTIRMIQDPQNNAFEMINNPSVESHAAYHAAVSGCPSSDGLTPGPNLSVLTTFPSYFSSREGKTNGHSNQKQNKSCSIDIPTHLTESAQSHSNHNMIQPNNFHQNL